MIPLIVIRPQPGCDATVTAAREIGLEAHGFPLFEVHPLDWEAPDPASFDALLIGSANALRHGGAALAAFQGKPTYAVGAATAEAARAGGLEVVATGEGGLQALLGQLQPDHKRLLRLAGRENVPLAPPTGVTMTERIVYASEALPMPAELIGLLAEPAVILLHSAEGARHFAAQCDLHAIPRSHIALAALGPRIAEAAGEGWAAVASANRPADNALLALARDLCQTVARPEP